MKAPARKRQKKFEENRSYSILRPTLEKFEENRSYSILRPTH